MDLFGKEHGTDGVFSPADVLANVYENKTKNLSILKNLVNSV